MCGIILGGNGTVVDAVLLPWVLAMLDIVVDMARIPGMLVVSLD